MKKVLSLVILAAMLFVMTVGVCAAVTFSSAKPSHIGTLILSKGPNGSEMTEQGGTFSNLKDIGGVSFCNQKDSFARYEFQVEKAGTYTFVVEYIARPDAKRFFDYAIDNKANPVSVDLEESTDKRFALITANLKMGKHNFFLMAPTGFDGNTVQSCDIYGWSLYLTKEAPSADPSNAPSTSDTIFAVIALLVISMTAAIIITKKQKLI